MSWTKDTLYFVSWTGLARSVSDALPRQLRIGPFLWHTQLNSSSHWFKLLGTEEPVEGLDYDELLTTTASHIVSVVAVSRVRFSAENSTIVLPNHHHCKSSSKSAKLISSAIGSRQISDSQLRNQRQSKARDQIKSVDGFSEVKSAIISASD